MSLEIESVLDRRRLKRSTALWRGLAIVAGAVALGVLTIVGTGSGQGTGSGWGFGPDKQIARVTIEGMITESRPQLRMLKRLEEAKHVAGVILVVNSPGGTTTGGEALYEALRQLSAKKPVVAQFGTVAASAAYIAGLGTDHIVARGNTITGSVGVIMQWPEVSEMLAKLGVKMNELKSGPLKASPSPFQPLDDDSRRITQAMIMESQGWFLDLVRTRRGVETATIPGLEAGRVFSGREAVKYRLADEIGGEAEAVKWLETERKVEKNLRIVDWRPARSVDWPLSTFTEAAAGGIAEAVRGATRAILEETGLSTIRLDGLVSVWHPGKS
jgi:protease-4